MSPIERRRTISGVPVERWAPVEPGTVLYEREPDLFGSKPHTTRKIEVVDQDTLRIEFDVLDIPHDIAEGQPHNISHAETILKKKEEINKPDLPFRTSRRFIRQRLRWIP